VKDADGQTTVIASIGDAENARPENDGQRKLRVWKMQEWKMTDKILANSGQNYGVWKMQDWKMTDKLYAKWLSAVSYTY